MKCANCGRAIAPVWDQTGTKTGPEITLVADRDYFQMPKAGIFCRLCYQEYVDKSNGTMYNLTNKDVGDLASEEIDI